MDYNLLSAKFREFSDSRDKEDKNKSFYWVLADALELPQFSSMIPSNLQNPLSRIQDHMDRNRDLNWIASQEPNLLNEIYPLYFYGLAYLNDKNKNISYFDKKTKELEINIGKIQSNIDRIDQTAKLISGASILAEYAKDFKNEADIHNSQSSLWLRWLIISVIGFFLILCIVFFVEMRELPILRQILSEDIKSSDYFNILSISVKIAIIFAYIQIPSFLKRNYFAERHLQQVSLHRKNVLRSLHAVYNTIDDQIEKDKIITIGATIAFSESETGFITTKEGAGEEDVTPSLLALFSNKR